MKNSRHYNRYSVKCNGYIIDNSRHEYEFIMNDISAGGISITTDREMKDESLLTIHFDISKILLPRTKHIRGKVVRKKVSHSAYTYGIRFYDLTNMEIVEIDEYLRFRHYSSLVQMLENPAEEADMRFSLYT